MNLKNILKNNKVRSFVLFLSCYFAGREILLPLKFISGFILIISLIRMIYIITTHFPLKDQIRKTSFLTQIRLPFFFGIILLSFFLENGLKKPKNKRSFISNQMDELEKKIEFIFSPSHLLNEQIDAIERNSYFLKDRLRRLNSSNNEFVAFSGEDFDFRLDIGSLINLNFNYQNSPQNNFCFNLLDNLEVRLTKVPDDEYSRCKVIEHINFNIKHLYPACKIEHNLKQIDLKKCRTNLGIDNQHYFTGAKKLIPPESRFISNEESDFLDRYGVSSTRGSDLVINAEDSIAEINSETCFNIGLMHISRNGVLPERFIRTVEREINLFVIFSKKGNSDLIFECNKSCTLLTNLKLKDLKSYACFLRINNGEIKGQFYNL